MNEIVTTGGPGTAINQWDPNSGAALPAYLTDVQDELGTNIPERNTVPSLSYEGKVWQIVKDGNKHKLQAQNADGDMVPVPIMRVLILGFNGERGRAYYPGTYNPAASAPPTCWSPDGKAPDPSVQTKQSPTCAACPMAVKGSKVQDGREMVACGQHRLIAVAPGYEILHEPLRLKIAVTSDWDKELVEHGWFAFRQYVDYLKSRGINHTGLVITKIKFDMQAQFPKLLFALDRVLSPEEIVLMKQAVANPKVAELLSERWTPAGVNGTPTDASDIAPQPDLQTTTPVEVVPASQQVVDVQPPVVAAAYDPRAAALADGWVQHPDSALHGYKGTDVLTWPEIEARYPNAPTAPAPVAPPAPAPAPVQVQHDPRAAALADGWVQHPDSAPHGYKGTEVLDWAAIEARYPAPGNAASAATPAAGSGAATSAPAPQAGGGSGQTATTAASPSDAALDPAVAALLGKWGG